jgi:hypothetical protein
MHDAMKCGLSCHPTPSKAILVAAIIGMMMTMIGCGGGYALRGKVVEGNASIITVTDRSDGQLQHTGISGVQIRIYRNPGRLNQELIASGVSQADGRFEIPIRAFGAGWMDEEWLIETYRSSYRNAEMMLRLPANTNKRPLLIMLARGQAAPFRGRDDVIREIERYR